MSRYVVVFGRDIALSEFCIIVTFCLLFYFALKCGHLDLKYNSLLNEKYPDRRDELITRKFFLTIHGALNRYYRAIDLGDNELTRAAVKCIIADYCLLLSSAALFLIVLSHL